MLLLLTFGAVKPDYLADSFIAEQPRFLSTDFSIVHNRTVVDAQPAKVIHPATNITRQPNITGGESRRESIISSRDREQKPVLYAAAGNNIPAGFEYLMEKQSTLVDVVFGGRVIGSFMTDYQPGYVEFRDPAAIVDKIPNLVHLDRERIVQRLVQSMSGKLAAHTDKSCYPIKKPGCDTLAVADAGVIFNPDTYQTILFVNPSYLAVHQNVERDEYFKAPQTGLTNVNEIGMAISGGTETDTSYGINARMLFGRNETHLVVNALATSEYDLSTNEFFLERDMPGYYYGGGLFRSYGPPLVSGPLLYGAKYATSYRTQVNRQQNMGNELMVYLPRPAQVEIWRDGRILAVSSYEAGNQVLDTSTLPLGNYTVTLKIREAGGITAEETRFYIKSDNTPVAGLPLINVEVGQTTQEEEGFPSTGGDFWAHGGILARMNDNLALGGDVLIVSDTVAGTAKAQLFFDQWIGNAALTVTSNSNAGMALDIHKEFMSVMNFNASVIQTWISDTTDPVPLYNVTAGDTTQLSGMFSVSFSDRSRLSLNATLNKSDTMEKNSSYGLTYTVPVLRVDRSQLYLTASATKSTFDTVALLRFDLTGNTSTSNWLLRAGYEDHSELESGAIASGAYGMTATNGISSSANLTVGAEQLSNSDKRVYTNAAITNAYGRLTAGAQVTDRANVPGTYSTFYTNYNTGVVATSKGVGVGGESLADSAVLVHLDGAPDIAQFDVFIDGQKKAKSVSTGSSVPLFVQPYERHEVYIRGVNAPAVDYDTTSRTVVLFTGNAQDIIWNIRSQHIVFGQLLDEAGMPLRNSLLKGLDHYVQTDEHGYFQGEITGETTIRATLPDGRDCFANIGFSQLTSELVKLGSVICKSKEGMFIPIKQPVTRPDPVLSFADTLD